MAGFAIKAIEKIAELPRWQKRSIVFFVDCFLLAQSIWIAFSLRLGGWIFWNEHIAKFAIGAFILAPLSLTFFGVYNAIFRFAGLGMMRVLLRATTVYAAAMIAIYSLYGFIGVPRTLSVIQPIIFFLLITSVRALSGWLIIELLGKGQGARSDRIGLIYGAGNAGQEVAASMRLHPEMRVLGFVDDDHRLDGQRLDSHKIFSSDRLEEVIAAYGVTDVMLALPNAGRARKRQIVERLRPLKVAVKTLPKMSDILEGHVSVSDMRPLNIEDLLGREPVQPNELLLGRTIIGKTVMVTGAGGSIGSELCRQILQTGAEKLIIFEVSEFSLYTIERELSELGREGGKAIPIVPVLGTIADAALLEHTLAKHEPQTVFHAAAYKHVPLVEQNPKAAIENNVLGTLKVVQSCVAAKVSDFILISTDKAVRPTNVMGATKRCAEMIVQAYAANTKGTRLSMVRFGNVLGSSGSVVPLFRRQIEAGGPVTLTDTRITRYFMTIPEAANLVIQAAGMARGGEVFVLDMGEPVKIVELARTMIQLSGLSVRDASTPHGDIEIKEVGLRAAEKLYEELLIGENAEPTTHPRIMRAREEFRPWPALQTALMILEQADSGEQAIASLQAIVPDFNHRRDNLASAAKI